MTSTRTPRIRAIAKLEVRGQRDKLYKAAFGRINYAIKEGFFLEAIAIIESLVADRLESRLKFLQVNNAGFKPLEFLIKNIRTAETDSLFRNMVDTELDIWRNNRNHALHEIAKIEAGETNDETDWDNRMKKMEIFAKEGLVILNKINNHTKTQKREHRKYDRMD